MKLTKKIVSLAAVLALSCTFAVSAENTAKTVAINGDIAEASGSYSVNLTTTAAETDQYTVLVYRVGDNGIMDTVATATLPAPSNSNITYINQDAFSTIKMTDSEAYTIAFALGAVKTDGVYKVMVGGTGIATAAVGYFEVGAAAPTYTLGDCDGYEGITIGDAEAIINHLIGAAALTGDNLLAADCDGFDGISVGDAEAIVNYLIGAGTIG